MSDITGAMKARSLQLKQEAKRMEELKAKAFHLLKAHVYNGGKLNIHPLANQYPYIEGEDFEELKNSIALHNGITQPLTFDADMNLIDGRNRLKAIKQLLKAGIDVHPSSFLHVSISASSDDSVTLARIQSLNVHRRHLTPEEKAKFALTKLSAKKDTRSARQKTHAKHKAQVSLTSPNGEVSDTPEEKISLIGLVQEVTGKSHRVASREIKRAVVGLEMEVVRGHRYTKSESEKVLGWLADNPKVRKNKAAPKVEEKPSVPEHSQLEEDEPVIIKDSESIKVERVTGSPEVEEKLYDLIDVALTAIASANSVERRNAVNYFQEEIEKLTQQGEVK